MTANEFLDNRAKAVYETWGKHLPGKIAFFSSETSTTNADIPLIRLNGVDDSYPPQKKSFMMLKYMAEHFGNHFEYFMRADDDLYVRTDKLELFLRSVNSSNPRFIGQTGQGNKEEFGHLGLKNDENFCMGGPGVIMSRQTLLMVAPHVRDCLKNLHSTHEDVEVGRCVRKYANIPCTWSYEMQNILYHNKSRNVAYTGPLKQQEVHRAITLHPIKNHTLLYRLHSYIQGLDIRINEGELVRLVRELARVGQETRVSLPRLDDHNAGITMSHLGMELSLQKWAPSREEEMKVWDFISRAAFQSGATNPRHKITSSMNEGLKDITLEFMEIINRVSKERGRIIDFKDVLYGYVRWQPTYALEYILDMFLLYKKYRGEKMVVPVRRHAYMQIPLGPLYIRERREEDFLEAVQTTSGVRQLVEVVVKNGLTEMSKFNYKIPPSEPPSTTMKPKKIHFIVPLSGRFKTFQRFMEDFRQVCLVREENVVLVVVSFRPEVGEQDTREDVEALISSLQFDYPNSAMTVLQANSSFARALALELGASQCEDNSLMFFVDVDMTFSSATLDRIRLHTIKGQQIYYPVVFSEYDPEFSRKISSTDTYDHTLINEDVGYWRSFGFGIVSMYKSELKSVGGLDTSIMGWGGEDVDLYEKVLKSGIQIFRAADPDLIHVFHRVNCDHHTLDTSQFNMCQGTRYSTYGAAHVLVKTLLENPNILAYKRANP
ncbi:hypothetical protein Pmani_034213 [Petrolisthes manimaculis]|uniref:Hexosyltransferase n=1 Tax=Petrolisthes manimaculis TaxID=1843537 RepID=A0AAE1TPX8_9EUCA|nr:hypothetical protein Pmani_034213 [Petrolisthes manimaculis]